MKKKRTGKAPQRKRQEKQKEDEWTKQQPRERERRMGARRRRLNLPRKQEQVKWGRRRSGNEGGREKNPCIQTQRAKERGMWMKRTWKLDGGED